ncbi:cell wall metabolism sensor histidine kinase WalK [Actinokineospora sp. UTMC 2448]|uniref:sensor histidine kinase n=1 Tax=Actinokineospora sp. UTMC 2448 TaxID=2268449 RepID=UPI002164E4D3|nr:HAMP domain-containing sensor histidine kinase [Actinokineospora sp. UTMC 2448]UVS81272.1 putative sensor histidine kinase TcrY [Actinokineospora sp. UTMC 2448]
MSLRFRLVATLLALVAAGVGVAVGALFGAIQDWASDRTDDVLIAVGDRLAAEGIDEDTVWKAVLAESDAPSYVQLRGPDGPIATVGDGPVLGDVPLGFSTVGDWLVRAVPSGENTLVVAMRTDTSDALHGRATGVAAVSALSALLGVAVLAPFVVRRALRPLDDLVDTASAIGGGTDKPVSGGTEVARLARALDATSARIDAALRDRDEANDRLRRFVADASHELRTPVAAIRGYAELFRRGAAERPDDLAKVLARIEAEAARMGRLVDDLLLLARLDELRPLATRTVDLSTVCADAVAAVRLVHPDRVWELDRKPTPVRGDPDRLRQIVDNLLGNVARHTPPGTPARVTVTGDGPEAVLTVRDHGPGLDPADQARVFERFHGRGAGTGLGLAIVAAIARAHGGSVSADNPPGGGAQFTVRIPAEPAIHGSSIQK